MLIDICLITSVKKIVNILLTGGTGYIGSHTSLVLNKPFCTSNLIENIKGVKLFSKCMVSKLNVKKK